MKRILICLVVLLCAAVQAEAKESDDRLESVKRLRRLGNLLLVYAIDHQGKYPDSLQELESWGVDKKDLEWLLNNVEYVGQGKSTADLPGTVIAYEKALVKEGGTTNVVFLDGHVESCRRARLKELGLAEVQGSGAKPADKYRLLPKPEQMSDSDGVPLYEKAVQSLPKNPKDITRWRKTPPGELPVRQVRAELKRFEPALKPVEQAARCKKCQWPVVQTGLAPLDKYRMIAQALALQARVEVAQKNYDSAIHTMQTGLGMARHIAEGPTLIQGLVGTAVGALLLKEAEHLIQAPDSPNLYWALESLPKPLIDLTKQMEDEIANIESQYRNPVTRMIAMKLQLEPAHERVRVLTKKLDRQVAALQCIEGLRLYANAHDGKFPNQLSDVTEVSVPVDPLSGKPFVYRRTDSEVVLEAVLPETARPEDALEYKLTLKE